MGIEHGGLSMRTEQLVTFLISPEQTIVEAMQKIDANAKGILFITNTDRKLIGADHRWRYPPLAD